MIQRRLNFLLVTRIINEIRLRAFFLKDEITVSRVQSFRRARQVPDEKETAASPWTKQFVPADTASSIRQYPTRGVYINNWTARGRSMDARMTQGKGVSEQGIHWTLEGFSDRRYFVWTLTNNGSKASNPVT